MSQITGYADSFSVQQGDDLSFYISTQHDNYSTTVERYFSVDGRPHGPGVRKARVDAEIQRFGPGRPQKSTVGSFATSELDGLGAQDDIIVSLSFNSTLPSDDADQWLITLGADEYLHGVRLRDRRLEMVTPSAAAQLADFEVERQRWYRLVLAFGPDGVRMCVGNAARSSRISSGQASRLDLSLPGSPLCPPQATRIPITLAADLDSERGGSFNGKLAEIRIGRGRLERVHSQHILDGTPAEQVLGSWLVNGWHFGTSDFGSALVRSVIDGAPGLRLTNQPCRAVTGPRWSGKFMFPYADPTEYDAIHFNDDMVIGGDWKESARVSIPLGLESGIYGLHIVDADGEDVIPFYVRPRARTDRKRILFLAPTNTYLAYGNEHNATAEIGAELGSLKSSDVIAQPADIYVDDHPELGLSLYDWHRDGTGVRFASRHRPLLNMRPFHRNWLNESFRHFGADFYLIEWLHRNGYEFDVATDEDLHREGLSLLETYSVVLTGSHPEYVSERMMDTVAEYLSIGGNLMYLGGNGFYWPIAYSPDDSGIIEMRRAVSGARNFDSPPGEFALSFTGESGGIWRNRGRSPHRLFGIGMGAVGWGQAQPYQRTAASYSTTVSWVFEDVDEDIFGDQGLMLGGAAGDEMDHTDFEHGTPANTVVLASSVGHDTRFQPASEYYTNIYPDLGGSQNPLVRADMTLLGDGYSGSVFSVGSICWVGALPVDDFAGAASRVTRNVLSRFVQNDMT